MFIRLILKSGVEHTLNTALIEGVTRLSPRRTAIDVVHKHECVWGEITKTYIIPVPYKKALALINNEEQWQDNDRCWREVERVYETRWDCLIYPLRRAA